ncbi:MAG: bifunctional riboflavin kinase/FAD synthetase [Clostridia bacterium]|nr:bifunctional riboflavin kinase/FAD synthetase [Clostridia bacterium]
MSNKKTAVALGSFDGVHIGHAAVLERALGFKSEYGFIPTALLFKRHPQECFGKKTSLLTSYKKRNELIEKAGLKIFEIDFPDVKDMSAEEFVEEIIIKRLNAGAVLCGYNYHFGKNSSGNCKTLEKICKKNGVIVSVADKVVSNGVPVSSSEIRRLISEGNIVLANKMLGREFSFDGKVFFGASNGKKLGFPTANQYFEKNMVVPKIGVYASSCVIEGKEYFGFTDIGTRPTFDNGEVRAETHLFGLDRELYGENIEVKLYTFLREEIKFPNKEALISQLNLDREKVKKYFELTDAQQ